MKMTNEALKIVPHEIAEPGRSSLPRLAGLKPGEDLDPARLMDLLGDIDGIKRDIQERMLRIEAVKEAKTLLMDEAARTEILNKRLTEMSRLMKAVDSGSFAVDGVGEPSSQVDTRAQAGRVAGDGGAIAWPKFEDTSLLDPMGAATLRDQSLAEDAARLDDSTSGGEAVASFSISSQIAELTELLRQGERSLADARTLLAATQAGYN
jgi:hypothetical protein